MQNLIKKVIIELSKNNFELSYIKEITIENGFDLRLSKRIKRIVITHGNLDYWKRIPKEIKIEEIEITQCYIGEMKKGTPRYQKSFLVKRTEAELKKISMERDLCENCSETCGLSGCFILRELTKNY